MRIAAILILLLPVTRLLAQWEADQAISPAGGPPVTGEPGIAASYGGIVHAVWPVLNDGTSRIIYRRSLDGGTNWETAVEMNTTGSRAENPRVAIAGAMNPVTHVVWIDDRDTASFELYYRRSTDWGQTWSPETALTNPPWSTYDVFMRGCVCCGSDVRVIWIDERHGNPDIFFKISTDNGLTWQADIEVTDNPAVQRRPCFAFCLSLVQAVWVDYRSGRPEIWARRSVDGGATWEKEMRLSSEEAGHSIAPAIVHAPNQYDSTLQLCWLARNPDRDADQYRLYHRRSTDLGLTWSPETVLGSSAADSSAIPSCTALGSVVYLFWPEGSQAIKYVSSTDRGLSWQPESTLCRPAGERCGNPSTALAGRMLHVVWSATTDQGTTVRYARNPEAILFPLE